MKKRILLVALALVMCLSMVLTSCNLFKKDDVQELDFSDIFAPVSQKDDYTYLSSSSTMNIAGNFIKASPYFIVTALRNNGGTSQTTYNVYDVSAETSVKSFSVYSQSFTNYYFDLISDKHFAVLKETYDQYNDSYDNYSGKFGTYIQYNAEYTVEIYDKYGSMVDSADASGWDYNFDNYYNREFEKYITNNSNGYEDGELFYEGNKLYKYENDEKVFIKEFGVEYMPNIDRIFPVGDYYCYFGESNYSYTVQIFNYELDPVANYAFPTYANFESDSLTFLPLGNDRIFIQYTETLHQDARNYDFRMGETGKYDLVTLILNVNNNTVTELEDVNYKVANIAPTRAKNIDEDYLNDVVENVAIVYYIDENEHLDMSATNYSIVGLSNNGAITAKINIEGCIAALPTPYGDNLFYAPSATDYNMYYIYDAQGEIVSYRSMDNEIHGDYIYTDYGIYTLNGNKVYDLENKVVYPMGGGSAIIYTEGTEVKTYYLFHDGTLKTIGGVGMAYNMTDLKYYEDYFYTVKETNHADYSTTYTYTYYNTRGDTIGTFDNELTAVTENEDYMVMSNYVDGSYTYYKFAKNY
ncbi:MAG: hypothetical protein E7677_03005 [Ruminococcaceae bacterium]|nr:hypothetical protein [Oscillospiraceae bacterium]